MAESILVVDDESDFLDTLGFALRREGFEVETAATGAAALEVLGRPGVDLVILDVMLPDMSGIEICRELRRRPETRRVPVILLTARGDEIDRVVGFEVGADDYVVKPFSTRELVLRVRARLRWSRASKDAPAMTSGPIRLDPVAHRAWVGAEELRCTAIEFRLLTSFLARPGAVRTREQLLDEVWGNDGEVTLRAVDTHVKRLRQKLGEEGDRIETLRGVGYRLREGGAGE